MYWRLCAERKRLRMCHIFSHNNQSHIVEPASLSTPLLARFYDGTAQSQSYAKKRVYIKKSDNNNLDLIMLDVKPKAHTIQRLIYEPTMTAQPATTDEFVWLERSKKKTEQVTRGLWVTETKLFCFSPGHQAPLFYKYIMLFSSFFSRIISLK